MREATIIIHGWSDSSKSFVALKKTLIKQGIGSVDDIYYGDYESREDNMTFDDVVDGLNDEMLNWGFIDVNGKKKTNLNVIVHSTGGLVIRHWIWRYYYKHKNRIADCPVKRLIMLAPANFGSPLAHRGKSFLGGLLKGRWKIGDLFETGKEILHGLELGSPYQWEMAQRDLLIKSPYYNAEQIQTTILVGIEDFQGMASLINKPGTDGTVVIAGTSLDTTKLRLDFSKPKRNLSSYNAYEWGLTNPPDDFAFGVLEKLDHTSIVDEAGKANSQVNQLLIEALSVKTKSTFDKYQDKLDKITAQTYTKTSEPQYQQFIYHAIDDQERPIEDYTLEFFIYHSDKANTNTILKQRLSKKEVFYSQMINRALSSQFHTHSQDMSYRRILVNNAEVMGILDKAKQDMKKNVVLSMKMYVPKIDNGIRYRNHDMQNIIIYDPNINSSQKTTFFYPNTTTLVELKVDRYNTYVKIGRKAIKH